MKNPRVILKVIGVVSVFFAALGFWYNFTTLTTDFPDNPDTPYFYHAFYIMSAICIVCHSILLLCGIQFLRLRTGLFGLFAGTLIFEFVYVFAIGFTWLIPGIGMSIGRATGVSGGGLMFQIMVLFPLWAPFLVGWARKRILAQAALVQNIQPAA